MKRDLNEVRRILVLLCWVLLAILVFYVLRRYVAPLRRRLVPIVVGSAIGVVAVAALISWHPASPFWPRAVDSGVRSITVCGKHHSSVPPAWFAKVPGVREGTWGPPEKSDSCATSGTTTYREETRYRSRGQVDRDGGGPLSSAVRVARLADRV